MRENPRRRPAAGSRPILVTVEAPTDTKDTTTGELTQTWAALDAQRPRRYASVEPLAGRELEAARQVQGDVSHRVRFPWDPVLGTVTPRCRVMVWVVGSGFTRPLEVLSVRNVEERNLVLELMCREAV